MNLLEIYLVVKKNYLELGRTMMVDAKLVLLDEVGAGVNRTLLKDLRNCY
jgi:branched-chain amino acid transport system ATP-binding protein